MEQLPARCSLGDEAFVLFIRRQMSLATLRHQVCERWGLDEGVILKYVVPGLSDTSQTLSQDFDLEVMYNLHLRQGSPMILLEVQIAQNPNSKRYSFHFHVTCKMIFRTLER